MDVQDRLIIKGYKSHVIRPNKAINTIVEHISTGEYKNCDISASLDLCSPYFWLTEEYINNLGGELSWIGPWPADREPVIAEDKMIVCSVKMMTRDISDILKEFPEQMFKISRGPRGNTIKPISYEKQLIYNTVTEICHVCLKDGIEELFKHHCKFNNTMTMDDLIEDPYYETYRPEYEKYLKEYVDIIYIQPIEKRSIDFVENSRKPYKIIKRERTESVDLDVYTFEFNILACDVEVNILTIISLLDSIKSCSN